MATDTESYLNEIVHRTVQIQQQGASMLYLNVLSVNNIGLLVQDRDFEYFIPWASVQFLRLATDAEKVSVGSLSTRPRRKQSVLK